MITDRRRSGAQWERALVDRVAAAAHAGVHLVQIRERDLEGRALARLVAHCVIAVRGTSTRIIVNDRLDVALAAGAHGVHLRGGSVPGIRVRGVVSEPLIVGRSVHARAEAARGDGLDYVIFGPIFQTDSKPGLRAAGPGMLAEVAAATPIPVLAVGGMTLDRVAEAARAGAAGFAAIGLFADCSLDALQLIVRTASMAFDTLSSVP